MGMIFHLEYGTCSVELASLIAVKCHFLLGSASGSSRFAKAEIRVVFETLQK